MIAIIQNNEIVNTGTLQSLFPNVCFPATGPNDEWKTDNGVVDLLGHREHDDATQHLETVDAYLEDGVAYTVRVVTTLMNTTLSVSLFIGRRSDLKEMSFYQNPTGHNSLM